MEGTESISAWMCFKLLAATLIQKRREHAAPLTPQHTLERNLGTWRGKRASVG